MPRISSIKNIDWKKINIVFLSLPNGEAQKIIKKTFYKFKQLRYIDLSADFRIQNSKIYKRNYGKNHKAKDLIKSMENKFKLYNNLSYHVVGANNSGHSIKIIEPKE